MSRERKQRDFQAGLAAEVEAWLRGDTSKRTFLKRLVEAGGAAALARPGLALLGSSFAATSARAAVELADPSTPFGQAQAAAVKASTEGPPENSAYRAVQAAKQYQGATLNMTYEFGSAGARAPQLLGPALAGPDRDRLQRRGAAAPRPVFQADRRAHRGLGRL